MEVIKIFMATGPLLLVSDSIQARVARVAKIGIELYISTIIQNNTF